MKARPLSWAGACTLTLATLTSCAGEPDPPQDNKDPSAKARHEMVAGQIANRGISDQRILDAMRAVPRHEFVPENVRDSAYTDQPLPIGHGQTVSQPYIVAFMTMALAPKPSDKVLEIGTGSGYQAAVLSGLVKHVYTIEIVKPLAERAASTLKKLDYKNVTVKAGDGYQGWAKHAPFDSVIVTCAPDHVPDPLVSQLREGGKMIIPVGRQWGAQELVLLEKKDGKIARKSILPVRFVPMTGKSQQKRD